MVSINCMLKTEYFIVTIGLLVNTYKSIAVVKANIATEKIIENVEFIQKELKKAINFKIIKSCIAYPDYDNNRITVLEGQKNYSVKIFIPVVNRGGLTLNPEKTTTGVGVIYIVSVK